MIRWRGIKWFYKLIFKDNFFFVVKLLYWNSWIAFDKETGGRFGYVIRDEAAWTDVGVSKNFNRNDLV